MICWKMLLKVFGQRILLSLLAATLLLAMADMAEISQQLVEREDSLRLLLEIYTNLAPSLALQALPVAVLLGVFFSITDLARSRELLAFRAAGASSMLLAAPALVVSALLAGAALLLAEHVAPQGVERSTRLQMEELGRMRSAWSPFHRQERWFAAGGDGLYHAQLVREEGRQLTGLWRYDHFEGRLTGITHVDEVEHDGSRWVFGNITSWSLESDDALVMLHSEIPELEDPSHFAGVGAHPEALTRQELRQAASLRKARGQPTLPFELEAQTRWTMPLLGLALTLVALGMGLRWPPHTHVDAAARAIAVAFCVWTLLAVCRAMGLSGMLSPSIAAFLPVVGPAMLGLGLLGFRR